MDEVDGKPGHVALQSGHIDALKGVPTAFLSLSYDTPKRTSSPSTQPPRLFSGADQPKAVGRTAGARRQ
jgi:hypothetical protein